MKKKCSQSFCSNKIEEDEIDDVCFICGYVFCSDHLEYSNLLTINEAKKRLDQIILMDLGKDYNSRLIKELNQHINFSHSYQYFKSISAPFCESCYNERYQDEEE